MGGDIIRMAREAGFTPLRDEWAFQEMLARFAALVRADEREICAKRLESIGCDHCAANIRARGHQSPAAIADRLARHGIPMPEDKT